MRNTREFGIDGELTSWFNPGMEMSQPHDDYLEGLRLEGVRIGYEEVDKKGDRSVATLPILRMLCPPLFELVSRFDALISNSKQPHLRQEADCWPAR